MRLQRLLPMLSLFTALFTSPHQVDAWEDSTDLGGGGYQQVRAAPQLAPAIALAAVVLAAMIAVSVQSQNNSTHVDF